MSNESQSNKIQIANLEKRIEKLESQEETNYNKIVENNTQLSIIVVELKNITKSMETLTESWKEAINNTEEKRELEKKQVDDRLSKLEIIVSNLNKKLDERTILNDSNKWQKSVWIIIAAIVGAVATMIASNIIK